jgi:hypothetical protein
VWLALCRPVMVHCSWQGLSSKCSPCGDTVPQFVILMCRAEAAQQIRPAQPCSMMRAPLRPQERHPPRARRTAHTSPSTRHFHCALAPASTAGRQAGSNPLQLVRQRPPSSPKGARFLGAAGSSLWCNNAQEHPRASKSIQPCLGQPVPQRLWVQDPPSSRALLLFQTLAQLLLAVLLCIGKRHCDPWFDDSGGSSSLSLAQSVGGRFF